MVRDRIRRLGNQELKLKHFFIIVVAILALPYGADLVDKAVRRGGKSASSETAVIPLKEFVLKVKKDLFAAATASAQGDGIPAFKLNDIELELHVVGKRGGEVGADFNVAILSLGGKANASSQEMHKVCLKMRPLTEDEIRKILAPRPSQGSVVIGEIPPSASVRNHRDTVPSHGTPSGRKGGHHERSDNLQTSLLGHAGNSIHGPRR